MMFRRSLGKVLLCFAAAAALTVMGFGSAFAGSATLNWQPPATNTNGTPISSLAGFKVHYGTASGNYSSSVDVGNVNAYSISNLADGVTYYFAVTAYNSSGIESAYSQEVSKKTLAPDIAGPVISGVYASGIASDSAVISWSTDELSDSKVEYGATTAYGYALPQDSTMTTAHSMTINGLAPSTSYNFRVISKDLSGNQTMSGNFTFTTAPPVDSEPPVISNIQVMNITATSATLTWTTDEPATSQVSYSSSMTDENMDLVTVHTVELSGLSSFTAYDFSVKSSDEVGNTAISATDVFKTSNVQPSIASFTANVLSGKTPLPVTFKAAASDSDGTITTYEWDFEGDGVYDMNTGTTPSATHTYNTVGTYKARVRVTDNGGASAMSDPFEVSVSSSTNQPPMIIQVSFSVSPSGSMTITFNVTASDPNGNIVKFAWDFDGNGTVDAVTTTAPVQYTYTTPGTYEPVVTVTDNQGGVATSQASVTVAAASDTGSTTQASTTSSGSSSSGGGKCFIATAAYGSYLEPEVMILREFRDRYLMTNSAGSMLVALYYDLSPGVAEYIAIHPWAKLSVRTLLTPLVYGLKYPYMALAFTLFIAAVVLVRWLNRRNPF